MISDAFGGWLVDDEPGNGCSSSEEIDLQALEDAMADEPS
jgi:hypothetical protein